ncbi:MAG TPA: hypothetical protein VGM88_00255 [Kofleriaceae bacterium]|jgi:hypothetical protein
MPSRPDLRDITTNVREAFADADRETLLDVLTFVVKEYVVEGPPPMLVHQAETLSDLQNLSFAQLVTALQTRFDFPELAQLVVDGEQVGVRVGGVVQPLRGGASAAAELPRPSAGVRVVETTLQQRPPAPPAIAPEAPAGGAVARPLPTNQAPPPRAGLSLRSGPSPGGGAPQPAAPAQPAAAAQTQPAAASPAPAAAVPEKKEGTGDDASARFSLLELD